MSEERRKRKAEREKQAEPKAPSSMGRKVAIAVVIVLAFAVAYYLSVRKRTSRLDTFAKCLNTKGAKMYGAYWCPHCQEQKEEFGSSFDYLNYVECGIKGNQRGQSDACKEAGVKHYPTWEFPDKSRVEGKQLLTFLSEKTGCSLP